MSQRVIIDEDLLLKLRTEVGLPIDACAREMGHKRTTIRNACSRLGIGARKRMQRKIPDTRLDNPIMELSQKFLQAKLV